MSTTSSREIDTEVQRPSNVFGGNIREHRFVKFPAMAEKAYKLTTEVRDGYLYARLETDATGLDIMVGYGNELAAAVRSSGLNNVLLENHAPILYDRAKYAVAVSLVRNLLTGPIRVAIVDKRRNDKQYLGDATAAARAAGFNARYFPSIEAAAEWLTTADE